ncbi:DUF6569 family protein [Methanobrevibacter sp.]|uniref:ARPP-1 family domain-containing protein n=1 Tax=Methanobrevibacter sp. TaxID=66852 RepID=UPI0026E05022|nr:DUF6569 family protein [Methanobrevibacter sp.]MDO5859828.1 tubulin-like protein [Methanobrevibacter sp.]
MIDIEILAPQSHENMVVVPLKSKLSYRTDILTLKKGLELGLAEVKELDESSVNTVSVKNNAVTPLILIDGEEILGANQNRIVNSTILIGAGKTQNIPVSCTEQGRWAYKSEFKQSDYIANYKTRRAKEVASRHTSNYQSEVWDSIHCLEVETSFKSPTSAMSESYDNLKVDHNKFLKAFKVVDGQSGVLIIQNGDIKGFEIFYNPQIYAEYHEKILRSYLIDNKVENTTFAINMEQIESVIADAKQASFEKKESVALESRFEFENDYGLGTLYKYDDEVIHWSYFKKEEEIFDEDILIENGIDETG